jgi:dihydrofolate reductase
VVVVSNDMRKLIVTNIVSLDGYYEGLNGDVMVMPFDQNFNTYNVERMRAADTMLYGRKTYEGFKDYWPKVQNDPAVTENEREISRIQNAIEKVVVSDSLMEEQTDPWRQTTTIVRRREAHTRIGTLKEQLGRDILMFGSRTLWNDLLATGLVDELHLIVGSGVLGSGTPTFDAMPLSFQLLGVRTWQDGNNVVLIYAPASRRRIKRAVEEERTRA